MSITITAYNPTSGSVLGGGILEISGTGFSAADIVTVGGVESPSVILSGGVLYCQIPPTMTSGTKDITVSDNSGVATASGWLAKNPEIFAPDFPYSIFVNGDGEDVTKLQKDRVSLTQSMNIISSYSIGFSSVSFELPLEMESIFYDIPFLNNIVVKQKNIVYFQGYPSGMERNDKIQTIKSTNTPFLNLLSKLPVAYTDTITSPVAQNIINNFASAVAQLPKQYNVSPFILNGQLLEGINIGFNGSDKAISFFQSLFDLLDIGLFVWNNTIYLYAVPENLLVSAADDISGFLISPPENISCMDAYYFDNFKLTYKTSPSSGDSTITGGSGILNKDLTSNNIFMDAATAKTIINRKLAIFSQRIWKQASFDISHSTNYKIGDCLSYLDFVFIITSIEEKYNCYGIKAVGLKKGA